MKDSNQKKLMNHSKMQKVLSNGYNKTVKTMYYFVLNVLEVWCLHRCTLPCCGCYGP